MSCFKFNSNDNENVNNDADEIILTEGFISWAGRNGEQQLLELMNFPISENFVYAENVSFCCGDDGKIIDRKIKQYLLIYTVCFYLFQFLKLPQLFLVP